MPFRTVYGVTEVEVARFIEGNCCVANWLGKYRGAVRDEDGLSGSKLNKARMLCRFFKWLRIVKDVDMAPDALLDLQLTKRQSSSIRDRQWLLNLVLEHSRDNLDFSELGDMRKYFIFATIKNFCDYHEVPLTTAKNVYGKKQKKKNHRKQPNLGEAKKVLGLLSQRDRTVLLIQLQSGMGIGEVLNKFSYMWHSQVKVQLDMDCERLKVEFDERKANGRWYFTYVSRDAIHELRKWLQERQRIVERLLADGKKLNREIVDGEPIFITSRGTPLKEISFVKQLNKKTEGQVTSHMFRKLFESEAKVPDLAVDREYIKFFMGHTPQIDDVGGTYDRNIEIREEIFEREYAKLEPVINIYSGVVQVVRDDAEVEGLRREVASLRRDSQAFREIVEVLRDPTKMEKFKKLLKE